MDLLGVTIGENIEAIRKKKGFETNILAKKIGMAKSSIVNIEAGRQGVTVKVVYALAVALGCSINEILPDVTKYKEIKDKKVIKRTVTEIVDKKQSKT